jgi:nucleoside-diphosphate-sugar epimerase
LVRSPQEPRPGLEWVSGDLGDRAALERLVEGAAAVVHCAGSVRGASAADFRVANVDGVANVLAAVGSVNSSVRFLHVSTLAAREAHLSHYAASKLEGERLVRAAPLRGAVIRPPAVYGPGDRELLPLLTALHRGLGVIPGHRGRFSLIFVEDLVEAMLAWLASPAADGDCYELHDGHPGGYDWDEIIDAIAIVRGARVRALRIPRPMLAAAAGLGASVQRLVGRAPMLTPGKVRELFHPDWVCDNGPFSRRTGWTPRVDLLTGLRSTLDGDVQIGSRERQGSGAAAQCSGSRSGE